MQIEKPKRLAYYFDTSIYNSVLDYPKIGDYIQELCDIKNAQIFVSPINIEEFKLAPQAKRIQLFGILKRYKDHLVLLRRPELLEELEYLQAFAGGKFERNEILEKDESELKKFSAFIDNPNLDVSEEEKRTIELTRLRNKYNQLTLRKEPKIIFDASVIKNSSSELFSLSAEELKEKIKNYKLDHLNKPYEEKDIINAMRITIILKLSSKRPQILYFFRGTEKAHPMFRFWWPGKKDDQRVAGQIMSLDFKKYCPGTWCKYNVYYKQPLVSIEPSNWGDLSHAFYVPYVTFFLTNDKEFFNMLGSINIAGFDYCGKVFYFNRILNG